MFHEPVGVEVIEHLGAMPYMPKLRELRNHMTDCERCAEAHASGADDCRAFCPEGHKLVHLIEKRMTATAAAAQWN